MPEVLQIWTYPIKSCAGVALRGGTLGPAGLPEDRSFMVVDADGRFRTQRGDPRLATIHPLVSDDGAHLDLRAPGAGDLRVPVDRDGPRRPVDLFGAAYTGIDQGPEVAGWISEVVGAPCRLVRVPPEHHRVTDGLIPGTAGYADSGSVHVVSTASLRELDDRIAAAGGAPVPMSRFRPNIVVDGWDEPHREDDAPELSLGGVRLGFAKLAVRCATVLVDQETGRKAGPEPLRTLARYRRDDGGGVVFGAKFAVLRPGAVAVGDEILAVAPTATAGPHHEGARPAP
ncbi:MOSC domain-containing protein [Pseudonocardia humida]|uniref:MOSC domain-containing protein n=1 Tax=Pseudonocardia humida TaxID=2800819 RepID=A0ABT1A5S6_9PSEU|nr:MOSC N-terminal beta barrel domain-containing protein [Pseudonocardia humida]MCO1658263.1 MOSC domain-containing protein [Pseudonocardia humida]